MAIVRKDKMLAGYNGNLESVRIYKADGVTFETGLTNGLFVALDGLEVGEAEVQKAHLAGTADVAKEVYLIHNPEVMYDERLYRLEDYVINSGKVCRAYGLFEGDIITLTTDLFADAVAVHDKLVVDAGGKLGVVADVTTAKVWFEVIEDAGYELHLTMKAFAVKVHRN